VRVRPTARTRSLWDKREAATFEGALGQRIYTSRLLGRDRSLVLHGGGNTSVKVSEPDLFGDEVALLHVKGSGSDLETIEDAGFVPLRMSVLLRMSELEALSDVEMTRQLRLATVEPTAPAPSVEAILHAVLPYRFVDHTHPDALISVMNTPSGLERVRALYGDEVAILPYTMPGFALARLYAQQYSRCVHPGTIGMMLMHHGLVTFGETARESYERTIELVTRAEDYLKANGAWSVDTSCVDQRAGEPEEMAALRHKISHVTGRPMIVHRSENPACLAFVRRPDVNQVAASGPATPDHAIRTKRLPMIGRDVEAYAAAYRDYFERNARRVRRPLTMLDPAPRVVLDSGLGLLGVGTTARDAHIATEIYSHTVEIISRADQLDSWQALPEGDIFDVEYWELEQAKLTRTGHRPPFTGEVVLITGAASGIGRACVDAFLERGAAVAGLDIDPGIAHIEQREDYLGIHCDVSEEATVRDAFERTANVFGGVDMLVLNAGIFPSSTSIGELTVAEWKRTMQVNLDANLLLMRGGLPFLKLAPSGGRVVVTASKNVPAPGLGAAAYSASKAALTQLARIAALEWGGYGIRVNVVHPNAVFDTAIWSADVIESRAASYGLTVAEYKANNMLHVEVTSRHVAQMIAEMCGPTFARTTGAQVPVDGGNERVI
jgi:rhamnose utilization protein RhaD (predicted bifunctional aldolase and dehydrogenase)/NAD(P)-dependent dehydrogenase (short-subunit alcohol dehydrogenase family)